MDGIKCRIWPSIRLHTSRADRHAVLPALSPLPISLMFFSHNKSGPDFLKQTMLWGPSPPITLCQFQSGLKYDSTVCASPCTKSLPPALSTPRFLSLAFSSSATHSSGLGISQTFFLTFPTIFLLIKLLISVGIAPV